jgi:hypothetical protein
VKDWLLAFVFTQIVEVSIYRRALERDAPPRGAVLNLLIAFGASTLTHPFVWFAFPPLLAGKMSYWAVTALSEAFAVLTEAGYFRLFRLRNALLWSLLANAASEGLGLLSRSLFGVP